MLDARRGRYLKLVIFACVFFWGSGVTPVFAAHSSKHYEVWLVDQSNSPGVSFGGTIHIYDGVNLERDKPSPTPAHVIKLAEATTALCLATTGAAPVRPHMIFFNSAHTHAILSFVTSGHVVIFDAVSRTPLSCIHTSVGAGGARQAHAAFPSLDDSYILVANQNGKLLERINTDYATNTFTLDPAATLNLATCTTPNGIACQAVGIRPDNAPITPIIDSTSTLGFITLRGGGLFVVDAKATPITILGEYDLTTVHANGFGGLEVRGSMYINSGGGTATNLSGIDVYQFSLTGYAAANPPNTPAPVVLFSDDITPDRDAHGLVAAPKNLRYLWVLDRGLNVAEVFDTQNDGKRVKTVDLVGTASGDPTPDLADLSPSGTRIFVSLRGPNPLTGDAHVATGGTPGLGIILVKNGGKGGILKSVLGISNKDATGVERADAHGIRMRLK